MNDKKIIQEYINNFRRHLSSQLKPGLGMECNIYPAEEEGAILEFTLGDGLQNDDSYKESQKTINEALKNIQQSMFGGNLEAFKFGGTNISLENNRLVLIKGENDSSLWTDVASGTDVSNILSNAGKPSK